MLALVTAAAVVSFTDFGAKPPPARAAETSKPYIYKVTDCVSPGDQFSINGEYFTYGTKAYIVPAAKGAAGISEAKELSVTQYDTMDEQYLVCRLPFERAGIYTLWTENGAGRSEGYLLNGPRPLYISEFEAWAGQRIDISGRNFDVREFGLEESAPEVWLRAVEGGARYEAELAEGENGPDWNNYRIAFTPSADTPCGEYEVLVKTGEGAEEALSSGQTLTVVEEGNDPLDIGVAWADKIRWDNVINAREAGAAGDGSADDTAALQTAVNELYSRGGGVLYLPEGTYNLTRLELPDYVVLNGAGETKTEIRYAATDDENTFIVPAYNKNRVGLTGIANLTIRNPYSDETERPEHSPDVYISLGESDRGCNHDEYANEGIFVKNVVLDYPMGQPQKAVLTGGKNRGLGLLVSASRTVVDNFRSKGFGGALGISNYRYARVQNSSFEYSITQVNVLSRYAFLLNNTARGRREFVAAGDGISMHGMMCRDNIHFEGNDIAGMGTGKNDGEVICVEVPGGNFGYGWVSAVEDNSITLTKNSQIDFSSKTQFGEFTVAIVEGTGKGQAVRAVKKPFGGMSRLKLLEPFAVRPDASSVVSLMSANRNVTVYDNRGEDCCKSILMYGNVIDAVVDKNVLHDTDGIMVWGSNSNGQGLPADMYVSFRNNHVSGVSSLTKNTSIDVTSGRFISGPFGEAGSYSCTMVYGVDIRGNTVVGSPEIGEDQVVPNETEAAPWQGIVLNSCTYSSHGIKDKRIGDLTNIIVTDNFLDRTRSGVLYTHAIEGIVLQNNRYNDILKGEEYEVHDYNSSAGHPSVNVLVLEDDYAPIPENYRTVDFDTDGGSAVPSQSVLLSEPVAQPAAPVKEGYIFAGWYAEEACLNEWDFSRGVKGDMTLYAKWTKGETLYKISYVLNGGTFTTDPIASYTGGEKISLPAPQREGFIFLGWFDNEALTGNAVTEISAGSTGDKTYYAAWREAEASHSSAGSESGSENVAGGCGSSASPLAVTAALAAGGTLFLAARRKRRG